MGQKQETKDDKKELPDFSDVENGPMSEANRECRDVICCIIFIANIIAMIALGVYGWAAGDLNKIYRGTSGTEICGQDNSVSFPYLYFWNPIPNSLGDIGTDNRVCVQKCPTFQNGALTVLNCTPTPARGSCTYSMIFNQNGTISSGTWDSTQFLGYASTAQLDRVCVPTLKTVLIGFNGLYNVSASPDSVSSLFQQGYLADFTSDVQNNWYWLLVGLGFAIVVSFIYMFCLRCCVGIIVWSSLIGTFLVLIALGFIFLYNGGTIALQVDSLGFMGLPKFQTTSEYYDIYGYICFGIAGVYLIVLLCCCSRIRLAVAVCKAAGQFVVGVYLIIFVPIVMTIIQFGLWVMCICAMAFIISSAQFNIISGDIFTGITDYTQGNLLMFYYYIFATLWTNAFVNAVTIFVIASACCMWYYSHGPGQDLDFPIARSYKMVFRYHFGSLAFGSFILAIVQFMQFLVEVFKKHAEATGQDRAPCFEYLINCLRCCLACVQRIVQFLNKTAYIQIALRGKNFCMAAKDGFEIVWSNGLRYAIVTGVGEIIMFMGKLFIAVAAAASFYALITFETSISVGILNPLFLILIVFVASYLIAMIFMSVYSVAMDTLLACFIVDQINQKAKGGKAPVYAPQELAGLMETD